MLHRFFNEKHLYVFRTKICRQSDQLVLTHMATIKRKKRKEKEMKS